MSVPPAPVPAATDVGGRCAAAPEAPPSLRPAVRFHAPSRYKILKPTCCAIKQFNMISDGDRVLVVSIAALCMRRGLLAGDSWLPFPCSASLAGRTR